MFSYLAVRIGGPLLIFLMGVGVGYTYEWKIFNRYLINEQLVSDKVLEAAVKRANEIAEEKELLAKNISEMHYEASNQIEAINRDNTLIINRLRDENKNLSNTLSRIRITTGQNNDTESSRCREFSIRMAEAGNRLAKRADKVANQLRFCQYWSKGEIDELEKSKKVETYAYPD